MRYLILGLMLLPLLAVAQVFEPFSGYNTPDSQAKILQEQAILSFQQGNYPQAEMQYRALFSLEPHNQQALDGLFSAWDALGKYRAILKLVKKLDKADSELVTANYKAYALLQLSRLPEARHEYTQALKSNPGDLLSNWYSWNGLGYTYKALGDYYKSEMYFT
nr:tetratricopeptide repeat protein [Candidatus Cloacimonadota bacterium]